MPSCAHMEKSQRSTVQFNADLQPISNGNKFCGSTSRRWSSVASVDGDFTGTVVMAGDLILTGLEYSDPANSGQVWQFVSN